MDGFVDIVSFYSSPDDRTIDKLSQIYSDADTIEEKIKQLIERHLLAETFKGKRILLKPNWVKHSSNEYDEICLRTNDQFLLAALKVILQKEPASVIIGDAPIQGCNWDKMITSELLNSINLLSEQFKIPVTIKDFRRVTFNPKLNNPIKERNPLSNYIIFDIGKSSYLEPVTSTDKRNRFRVTQYNPDRFNESHKSGMHKYCITKELFEADIVISLPKIKTHQKTGITGALKNLVGLNGDKDFLPHHRIGGTGIGGDCYPGRNIFRFWSELSLDQANRNQGKITYKLWTKLSSALWLISFPKTVQNRAAAWYGNDTTWRMVMDLNKVAIFGKTDGTLSEEPQRVLFSLCDGIIGGQGNGPLRPEPLPLGVISFSNNSGLTDICMATLMGFDVRKIPLLANVNHSVEFKKTKLSFNNHSIQLDELIKHSIVTLPAPGWVEYFISKQ